MSRCDFEEVAVYEMDGLPMAYMEFSDGTNRLRFVYRVICYLTDTQAEAQFVIDAALATVYMELKKLGGGVILWRRRPEVVDEKKDLWRAYARFATSPPLSEEVWESLRWMSDSHEPVDLRKSRAAA